MEELLYYCRVVNKDVKISCEDAMCIMNHSVLRNYGVLKCNLHVLWETIIFGFVITNPNVPTWAIASAIINTLPPVVKQCILNQSQGFRLLSNALAYAFNEI